jgi:hypothetical protein
MSSKVSLTFIALAISAVPLSAQISTTERARDRILRGGIDTTILRSDTRTGRIDPRTGRVDPRVDSRTRTSSRIPPGHLPPRGLCRVWIDGVPPGQQPPVTDCATAERNRTVNSRVIYGDQETFRGRANGKFKHASRERECSTRDAVVIDGRVRNICRDDAIFREQRRRNSGWEDDRDDDRWKRQDKLAKHQAKANKSGKRGKGR